MTPFDLKERLQSAHPPTPTEFSDAVRQGLLRASAGERPAFKKRASSAGIWATAIACSVLVMSFLGVWTANPALADGISFRQGIISFFNGDKKEVQQLVHPPLTADPLQHGGLPVAKLGAYEVTLSETVFDGNNLYLGYTTRMQDGSALPSADAVMDGDKPYSPPEGEVEVDSLRIDGSDDFSGAAMSSSTLYIDPFEAHTSLEIELEPLLAQRNITDESNLELLLGNYAYQYTPDYDGGYQVETDVLDRAVLSFRINTSDRNAATTVVPQKAKYNMGGWQLEILKVELSPMATRLHYRETGPIKYVNQSIGTLIDDQGVYRSYMLMDEAGNTYRSNGSSSTGKDEEKRFTREGTIDFEGLVHPTDALTLVFESIDANAEEYTRLEDWHAPIRIQLNK